MITVKNALKESTTAEEQNPKLLSVVIEWSKKQQKFVFVEKPFKGGDNKKMFPAKVFTMEIDVDENYDEKFKQEHLATFGFVFTSPKENILNLARLAANQALRKCPKLAEPLVYIGKFSFKENNENYQIYVFFSFEIDGPLTPKNGVETKYLTYIEALIDVNVTFLTKTSLQYFDSKNVGYY